MDNLDFNDSPSEECGVVGVSVPNDEAAKLAFFGLYALQHRGQEAAGIAVSDGKVVRLHKDQGLVSQVFKPEVLNPMVGNLAIGHTRYSTTGGDTVRNVQPFLIETMHGPIGLAHNGNLVNADDLRSELLKNGVGLQSSSDSEILTLMLAASQGSSWEERLAAVMPRWNGAYSLVLISNDKIIAVRDPWGFRPLSYGSLPDGGYVIASETGALETVGCKDFKEVKPGEIIVIQDNKLSSYKVLEPKEPQARCTFEHIYFSRPDAIWDDLSVHAVRQSLGEELAREHPVDADVVIPVPDSSTPAAIGYARILGIPYNEGFVKNRYIGRTFIEPTDELRKSRVALKFNPLPENLEGKRVIMIDDSIVRGNTSGPLVKLVRDAGATEVHMRVTCPPIAHPCFFGVDMGTYEELIANKMGVPEMSEFIGADSLGFLSVERMMKALGRDDGYCNACFTGEYPIPVQLSLLSTKQRFDGVLR